MHCIQDLHKHVLDPLLVLFALALELPEDYLTKIHTYEKKSEVCPLKDCYLNRSP